MGPWTLIALLNVMTLDDPPCRHSPYDGNQDASGFLVTLVRRLGVVVVVEEGVDGPLVQLP